MSFEIEDVDDDEEEESYNFQSKWSQPSKSFFGGQDSELNEEDEYNFDFGKPKAKKVKSPPQWKAEPVSGNNNGNLYKKKDNNEASIAAPGSALNKAEDMLKRYGGGSSAPPIRTSAQSKAFSLHFDEDDLSLDSQSEGELDKSLNLSQSDRRNEMPFSPQAEAFENERGKGPGLTRQHGSNLNFQKFNEDSAVSAEDDMHFEIDGGSEAGHVSSVIEDHAGGDAGGNSDGEYSYRNDTFESSNVRHSEDESSEGSGDEYEESQAISRSEDEIEYDEAPKPKLNVMSFADLENVSGWNTKDLESSRVDHLDVIEEECIREPDMLSKHVDSSEPDSNAAYVKPSVSTVKEPSSNANTKANLNQSRYSDYESNSEESESSENLEALSETITANIHLKQAEHDKNLEALNAARQVHINEHQKDSNAVVKMDPVPAEATRQPQNVSAPVLTPMVEVTYTAVPPQTTASVQGLPPPTVAQEPSIPSVTSMQSGNPTQQNQQSIGGPGWPGQHPCPPQPFPQMNPSQQYPCGYPMYSGTQPYSGNPPYQNQYPNPSYPLYYPNSSTNGFHPQSSWQQPTAFPPAPPVQQQPPAYFPPSGIPPAVNASTASGMSGMTKPYYSTNTYDPVVMQLLHELHQAKLEAAEANNRLAEVLLQLHRSEIDKTSSNYRRSCSSPSRSRSNSIDSSHSPKRKSTSTATSIPQIDTDTDSDLDDDYEDDFEVSRISTATPSSKKSVNVSYEDGFDSRSVRKNNNVHIHIPKRGLSPRTKTKTSKTKSPSKNENKSNADKYLKQKDTSSFGSLPASMNTSKSNSEHRNDITTSNDHLGSALLNSQALFRKQLSSLKSRLDIANSSYYDAMLRNSK